MIKSEIKSKLCNDLISNNLVKEFDVIEHSFTDGGGRDIKKLIVSTNNIFPTLTTRPDVLGVVVKCQRN